MDRKPKGFGYVEFGTLEGLKTALALSGSNLAGRNVRISVADPPRTDPTRAETSAIGVAKDHYQICPVRINDGFRTVTLAREIQITCPTLEVNEAAEEPLALAPVPAPREMARYGISRTGRGKDLCPQRLFLIEVLVAQVAKPAKTVLFAEIHPRGVKVDQMKADPTRAHDLLLCDENLANDQHRHENPRLQI